jgi:hypothetical protein
VINVPSTRAWHLDARITGPKKKLVLFHVKELHSHIAIYVKAFRSKFATHDWQ